MIGTTDADGFRREIRFRPAFDKRSSDPSKNYGIGSMMMWFYLIGPNATIQFALSTSWYPKHLRAHVFDGSALPASYHHASGTDIGYHAPAPQYEGQRSMAESCEFLDGKPCYYDGTSLGGADLFDRFVVEGEDVVWKTLREWYDNRFGGGSGPDHIDRTTATEKLALAFGALEGKS